MYRPLGDPDEDTIELFLGDLDAGGTAQAASAPPAPEAGPVFVDTSGRRQRRVRRWGCLLVVPAVGYIVLLVSTLLGGPTVESPLLPSTQAPHTPGPGATASPSARGTASRSPRPSASRGSASSPALRAGTAPPPGTGPGPVTATTGPGSTAPEPPGNGHGRNTAPPGQGGGKPNGRP